MNRRMALIGMIGAFELIKGRPLGYRSTTRPTTSLGYGLEIRDYRLFPTEDVMRFIVEVHNATDQPVETPIVGLILDNLPDNEEFGVAVPSGRLLQPHTSTALIGVAPTSMVADDDWGQPRWLLCQPPAELDSSTLDIASVTLEFSVEAWSEGAIHVIGVATNPNNTATAAMMVEGVCYDSSNRICGIVSPIWIGSIEPDRSQVFHMWTGPNDKSIANPFVIVDSADELKVVLAPQPSTAYRPISCPIVMPWGR
jgi:hypothetical protein